MRTLSKSKIIAFRQCPKRLWLDLRKPELCDDSAPETVFKIGNQVGDIARTIYDSEGSGVLIDIKSLGLGEDEKAFPLAGILPHRTEARSADSMSDQSVGRDFNRVSLTSMMML